MQPHVHYLWDGREGLPDLAVGEAAVLEDLQQYVEDVRVGLLNLVKQHHCEGLAADGVRQLPALLCCAAVRFLQKSDTNELQPKPGNDNIDIIIIISTFIVV
eukprot:scaffold83383_cov28-Prasinocladus_malaysianus.AAC.1